MPIYGPYSVMPSFARQHTSVGVGGTANETTLFTATIPGGTLGLNGGIFIYSLFTVTASSNTKTIKIKLGSTTLNTAVPGATHVQVAIARYLFNRNNAASQVGNVGTTINVISPYQAATAGVLTSSVNTAVSQDLTITGQTSLETGFATTSMTRTSNVTTVVKASHGLNNGEYVEITGAVAADFNTTSAMITYVDANTFTYANTGANDVASVQGTVKRFSVIALEAAHVELFKPW